MFKGILSFIITLLALSACSIVASTKVPELLIYDMTGTAIEANATIAAEHNYSTEDIYHLTATRIIFEATSGILAAEQVMSGAIQTSTADYWATLGGTPTTDSIALTETQVAFEAIMTDIQSDVDATDDYWETQGITPTPNFALTATQMVFEVYSGTYEAEATSGTTRARQTAQRMTREVPITATANYWATQGATPTFPPGYLTERAWRATRTQAAETAIANGCEIREHNYQEYTFYYPDGNNVEVDEHDASPRHVFDCPNPDDQLYEPIDIYVELIMPDGVDETEFFDLLEQALILLLEYPPIDTTLGTDNISINIAFVSSFLVPDYNMLFSYSAMESALEEGLERGILIDALGGLIEL